MARGFIALVFSILVESQTFTFGTRDLGPDPMGTISQCLIFFLALKSDYIKLLLGLNYCCHINQIMTRQLKTSCRKTKCLWWKRSYNCENMIC